MANKFVSYSAFESDLVDVIRASIERNGFVVLTIVVHAVAVLINLEHFRLRLTRSNFVNQSCVLQLDVIPESSQETDSAEPHLVIWGTNVSVQECKKKFKQFILRYIDPSVEQDEIAEGMNVNEPLYLQKLEEVRNVIIDGRCFKLFCFNRFIRSRNRF